jgi:hypothetical protein
MALIALGSIPLVAIMVAMLMAIALPDTLTAIVSVVTGSSHDQINDYGLDRFRPKLPTNLVVIHWVDSESCL